MKDLSWLWIIAAVLFLALMNPRQHPDRADYDDGTADVYCWHGQ